MILSIVFTFFLTVTGSLSAQWEMSVPPQVNSTEWSRVVLPCSFSHPQQDTYTGRIHVKWRKGHYRGEPFFQCTLTNRSRAAGDNCSSDVAAGRFSLSGDPRRRDLSLFVKELWLNDSGVYMCRVELEYESYQSTEIELSVKAPARVVSLSRMPFPYNTTLECVAVGSPQAVVTWFSSSKGLVHAAVNKDPHDPYAVRSSIHISSQEVYTCQAQNALGSQVKVFPPHQGPSPLTVGLSVLVGLGLLVGLGAALLWMKRRGASLKVDVQHLKKKESQRVGLSDTNQSKVPIYANYSERSGDQELIYADIDHSSPKPSTYTVPPHSMENDIIYSDVNKVNI